MFRESKLKSCNDFNILIGVFCAIACETFYGLSYVITKEALAYSDEFTLLGWRFFTAFLVINIFVRLGVLKINLKGKNFKPLVLVGFFCPCLYFAFETLGISNTSASESGVFLACIPVSALIASFLILNKKPNPMQVGGIFITFAGVILTVLSLSVSSSFSVPGYVFLFTAVISYALYTVFVEKASTYKGSEITYVMLGSGAIVFFVILFINGLYNNNITYVLTLPFKEIKYLYAVLFLGVFSSILAFFLSNIAIAKIGVNKTASFIGISTIVSIIAGNIFLEESFTVYQIAGAIIIVMGVYLANKNNSKKSKHF